MDSPIDYQTCRQGAWADCWLLSALIGLASNRPDEIRQMIREVGDGSFEVTFPGREPQIVRPEDGGGTASNGVWAVVIEAAARRFTDATTSRVLRFGEGITLLTGRGTTGYTNVTGVGFAPAWRVWSRTEWFEQRVADATARSKLIVLGGSDGKWTTPKVPWVIPRHCYALLAYEPDFGTCRVRDPHGTDNDIPSERKRGGYGPGEFWLTSDELQGSFCGLTIEND